MQKLPAAVVLQNLPVQQNKIIQAKTLARVKG